MTRVVWLDGGLVDPSAAALAIDDPGVRYGEGLFETMRAHDGAIPLLERHLARLAQSIAALRLAPMPPIADVRTAALAVAGRLGTGPGRVRVTVTPHPTLLVEATTVALDPHLPLTAVTLRGAWSPGRRIAEHKTLSFLGWRDAQRRAAAAGADVALLCDEAGRLGEAGSANVFAVVDGALVTPPIDGILPGVIRSVLLEIAPVRVESLEETVWRAADELFVTSGVRGVAGIGSVDGVPVGDGDAPMTERLRTRVEALLCRRSSEL